MSTTVVTVFVLYLIGILLMGIYYSRRIRGYEDFVIGGRSIGPFASSMSLISSYMSGYTYTAAPGLSYTGGYSSLWWAMGDAPGNSLSFGVLGRRLRKYSELLRAITMPEYYERRFNSPALRLLSSLIIVVFVSMYLVAQWQASGKLLSVTFGTSYTTGVFLGGIVVLAYTLLGGYLAVVYTDAVQAVIMFIGTQVLFWMALGRVGGFNAFHDRLAEINPEFVTPWGPGGAYLGVMAVLTPIILIVMGSFGMPHITVRHLSLHTPAAARQAMLITAIFVGTFSIIYYITGGLSLVLLGGGLEDVEQSAVVLWFEVLPPVLAGILTSAAVASIMSTADSFLIMLVTTIAHDLLYRFGVMKEASEEKRLRWARVLVAALAVLSFLVALNPPALVFTIVIFAFGGMALAFGVPNLFSVFWKRTSATGVLASQVLSMIVYVGATAGGWNIAGLDPFILGLIVAVAAVVVGSLASPPPRPEDVEVFEEAASYAPVPRAVAARATAAVAVQAQAALALGHAMAPARRDGATPRLDREGTAPRPRPAFGWPETALPGAAQ